MGGFASIFTGSNPTLGKDIGQMGDLAGYSSKLGQQDTSAASNFYKDILSGDPTKIGQVLAPQTRAITGQANQNIQTQGQFGNRSGGVAGSNQQIMDTARQKLNDLIGQLTGGAASGLATIGNQNLQLGQQGTMNQANLSQTQLNNIMNSILGKGLGDVAETGLNAAERLVF